MPPKFKFQKILNPKSQITIKILLSQIPNPKLITIFMASQINFGGMYRYSSPPMSKMLKTSKMAFKTFFETLSKFVEQAKLLIIYDFESCIGLILGFILKKLKNFVDNYGVPFWK